VWRSADIELSSVKTVVCDCLKNGINKSAKFRKKVISKTAKITRRLRNLMLLRSQLATVEF